MNEAPPGTHGTGETKADALVSTRETGSGRTRRQFLGTLGSGVATIVAVSGRAGAQETPTVSMGNNYFDPVGVAVEPGTSVRFEIDDGSHSATAYAERIPSEAATFDSGTISQGGFEHTFDTPGTYDYYCIPHKSMGMTGRIVVGDPGGPAENTPIPDGDVPASGEIVTKGSISIDEVETSGTRDHGGMMGDRSDMMNGGSHGWNGLIPAGALTTALGLAGGVAYWISGRNPSQSSGDDTAIVVLREQYAQGSIDEEEFERRLMKLKRGE